jgi:intracellular sulfur oxidation DsrE/DsrF family protein
MTNNNDISNELLNAYLDNELDSEERGEIMAALENDPALAGRLCELRNTKELTQFAYNISPSFRHHGAQWKYGKRFITMSLAASLWLAVGSLAGWFAHDRLGINSIMRAGEGQIIFDSSQASLPVDVEQKKVILHIDSAEPDRLTAALDSAEDLLVASAANGNQLDLEIIANARGLDLLRVGTTPFAARITELTEKYDNLSILACSRAIKRLQDLGIKVKLVPEAGIAPSALDQIVDRLKQGWVYIKV